MTGAVGRVPAVDALRGIAAAAVWAQHVALYRPWAILPTGTAADGVVAGALETAASWGVLGVPMFFVLSGFCVGRTWLKSDTARGFAWRRWRRIHPKYLASVALVLLLGGHVDDFAHGLAAATLTTWPATYQRPLQVVYWTLSYEVAFYAVLTAVLLVPPGLRRSALVAVAAAGSILTLVPHAAHAPGPLFFCCCWPLFALGLALALSRAAPRGAAVVAAAACVGLCVVDEVMRTRGFASTGLVTVGVLTVIDRSPRPIPGGLLASLGRVSYGFYLFHLPIMTLCGRLLPDALSLPLSVVALCAVGLVQFATAWLSRRVLAAGAWGSSAPDSGSLLAADGPAIRRL